MTENTDTGVVIVGGGGGGLTAAVAAAERGVKVMVVEARNAPGGNAIFAGGFLAAGSELQKRHGIEAKSGDMFKQMMSFSHWRLNARLVRTLIDNSGSTVDWLEKQGVKFELNAPPGGKMPQMTFPFRVDTGRTGAGIVKALTKRCDELGVQIIRNTRVKKILTAGGRITGIMSVTKGNEELKISAKAIVISTGGFVANKELMKQLLPPFNDDDDIYIGGLPHQGDGIMMAREIGAAIEQQAAYETSVNKFPWSSYLFLVTRQPSSIWVNKNGERFADETSFDSNNAVWMQPGKITYTIFDENIKQLIFQQPINPMDVQLVGENAWAKVDEDLKNKVDTGRVKITNDWGDMAQWMRVAPEVLKATINEYNAGCDSGNDFFGKDKKALLPLRTPPYYALKTCINVLVTHGGIKINHRTEVIDTRNNIMPGLYAAGVETAGTDENVYGGLPGHSLGFTINSGRIAGENAADYVKGVQV